MLAGNANVISWSLFSPANTLAALLANHFPEAGTVEVGALMYAALVLLAITLLVNIVGTVILQRADAGAEGAALMKPRGPFADADADRPARSWSARCGSRARCSTARMSVLTGRADACSRWCRCSRCSIC